MHKTEGANNATNLFTDGPPGTTVEQDWLNAIQEEIVKVIEDSGATLKTASTETRDQLSKAIQDLIDKSKYGVDAEAADAYIITRSPAPLALYDGMTISFKANTANTGAATLNDTGLGAKDLRKNYDQVLETNDIKAGQIITAKYDVTNDWYQIQSQSSVSADAIIKAWIQFDGTGVISILDSFNVASITDDGVGIYTLTWDVDFANINYSMAGMATTGTMVAHEVSIPLLVGEADIRVNNHAGVAVDTAFISVIAIGDQ